MFTNSLLKRLIAVTATFGSGYYTGQFFEQQKSKTPEHAINVIQNQPGLTWRLKYFSSGTYSNGGRDGLWVARFKPRYTGTAAYVVFYERETHQNYLLLTLQNRIINQQKVTVCEPPIGFFNGEYPSTIPHIVSESAEREIENQVKQGNDKVNQKEIYHHFMQQYNLGKLPKDPYEVDQNLFETAYREIKEEAGLDIEKLQKNNLITISHQMLEEVETPAVLSIARRINITGDKLVPLEKKDNDEVKHNEWIPVKNIDIVKKTVKTSQGEFPIKPYDKVPENIQKIIESLDKKPRRKLS